MYITFKRTISLGAEVKNGRFEGETSEAEVNGVFQQGATPVDPLSRFLIIDFRLFPSRTRHGSNGEAHPMFSFLQERSIAISTFSF